MATYYVRNGGNDALAGTADGTAWANHPWMSTYTGGVTLAAGDIVYMKCGSTWTKAIGSMLTVAQNGTAGNYIRTTSYSTGAKPKFTVLASDGTMNGIIYLLGKSYIIIDGLEIQGWSSTYGAGQGISFIRNGSTYCHDIIITNCTIHEIPHSGIINLDNCWNIDIGDVTATTTATTSSYSNHIYNFGYAGVGLCGSNPADGISNHRVYYNYIHNSTRTVAGDNAYGIHFEATTTSYGWPKYCYARYNNIQNIITWESLDMHGGSYMYFQDNYIKNFGALGILVATYSIGSLTPTMDHVYVERNVIEVPASGWVTGRENAFIVIWNSLAPNTTGTDIFIRDNIMFYTTRPTSSLYSAIRVQNTKGLTISGNNIYNGCTNGSTKGTFWFTGSVNENIVIERNFIKDWGPVIYTYLGAQITGSFIVRENIFSKPPNSPAIRTYDAIGAAARIYLYNNVFLNYDYAYVVYMPNGITSGGTLTAKNNIFGRSVSGALTHWYLGAGTYDIDYNMYWNSTTASPFYISGARTFAVWQSTYGHDTHGYNATNPLFLNAGGSYLLDTDFQVSADSPVIDKATNIGITEDYFGNTVPYNTISDIGVFEYTGPPVPSIYYMDATIGNDTTGNGSLANPWKTLKKATSMVSVSGSTIFINNGSYTESDQSVLRNRVSIQGQSKGGVQMTSTYAVANQPLIKLETANGWLYDEGHQSISNLTINGGLVTNHAIAVNFRHYVDIHDCAFTNFLDRGVIFYGCSARTNPNPHITNTTKSYYRMPDAYALGNRFTDNTLTNCGRYTGSKNNGNGAGNLQVGAQDGMVISGNVITQTGRAALQNGYGIKFHDEGYTKNCIISGNTITVGFLDSTVNWEFAIEWWNSMGGDIIRDNRIYGAIDLVNAWDHHSVGFAVNVYDNDIGRASTPATQERGILLEGAMEYINVFRNHIHHVGRAIYIPRKASPEYTGQDRLFHVDISVNLMVNLGQSGSQWQTWGIQFDVDSVPDQSETQYFYVRNNVIEAVASLVNTYSGIILPQVAEMSFVYVENNIILNFDYHAIYARYARTKATNIYIRNNIAFGNGNSNDPVYANGFPTAGITYVPNIKSDPEFKGGSPYDYHIASIVPPTSPAYRAGQPVNIIEDYDENPFYIVSPTIGAYEILEVKKFTTINIVGGSPVYLMAKPSWITVQDNADDSILSVGDLITDGMVLAISPNAENLGGYRTGFIVLNDSLPNPDELLIRVVHDANPDAPTVSLNLDSDPSNILTLLVNGPNTTSPGWNYLDINFTPYIEALGIGVYLNIYYSFTKNGVDAGSGVWSANNNTPFSTHLLLLTPVITTDTYEVTVWST